MQYSAIALRGLSPEMLYTLEFCWGRGFVSSSLLLVHNWEIHLLFHVPLSRSSAARLEGDSADSCTSRPAIQLAL